MRSSNSASVLGYVKDSSGAAVPNATVTLTNIASNIKQTATSDAEGRYEFASVPIGTYRVETEAAGFEHTRTQDFQLTTDARQRVDLALKHGAVSETVTVSAAPTVIETETSSRGEVIGTKQIEDLPLNGRSYADLALLTPGVRKSFLENQTTTNREASFNINGQRSAFNNFLLNGLDNNSYGTSNQGFANENIPPSPDAVSEFRIETDNYSAEYGRASGGVINASIRRGTNQFHGRAWDYIRNTVFNAIGPFASLNPITNTGGKALQLSSATSSAPPLAARSGKTTLSSSSTGKAFARSPSASAPRRCLPQSRQAACSSFTRRATQPRCPSLCRTP